MTPHPGKRLTKVDIRKLDDAFDMHGGYVLDFSDATMAEWFEIELGLDLEQEKYRRIGGSKAKRLREFILIEPPALVGRVLRALWKYRVEESECAKGDPEEEKRVERRLFEFIQKLEGDDSAAATDAFETYEKCETLSELVDGIRRDLDAGRHAAGLDRLHLYCMKRFAYLLQSRGGDYLRDDPLHSRAGKYIKLLAQDVELTEMILNMLRSNIKIFERFNGVRNDRSLAHDNVLLAEAEARYIFESVAAALRFFKSVDGLHFGEGEVVTS
ncbi:abortive infection family protein [Thalassovita aquimarina]|uniref:Abortive infection family protein n=1 Tax=Thalassovita aquimarina TaxID=2785917 RepID=A0ABS5HP55_9RHOB|nr:abortive infection family protein [Thalassovita aquimarina]MBR9650742.1 abortive infection family protein [Thalassovita aquimarina]